MFEGEKVRKGRRCRSREKMMKQFIKLNYILDYVLNIIDLELSTR